MADKYIPWFFKPFQNDKVLDINNPTNEYGETWSWATNRPPRDHPSMEERIRYRLQTLPIRPMGYMGFSLGIAYGTYNWLRFPPRNPPVQVIKILIGSLAGGAACVAFSSAFAMDNFWNQANRWEPRPTGPRPSSLPTSETSAAYDRR